MESAALDERRVEPNGAGNAGATMRLHANMDHMHLIDPASGLVL